MTSKPAVSPTQNMLTYLYNTLVRIRNRSDLIKKNNVSDTIMQTLKANNASARKQVTHYVAHLARDGIKITLKDDCVINDSSNMKVKVSNKTPAWELSQTKKKVAKFGVAPPPPPDFTEEMRVLAKAIAGGTSYRYARVDMFAFMGNHCVQCSKKEPGLLMTGDHIYPKMKYPLLCDQLVNLQPLCSDCNTSKADTEIFDLRPSEMKLNGIQRLLVRRKEKILPTDLSARDIEILTLRILLFKYQDIKEKVHCSESTISTIINRNIPELNNDIKKLNTLIKKHKNV